MKVAVLALAALALTGCESTQSKSAKLESVAQRSKHEKGLVISEQAKEIKVEGTTMLQDANGAATVVELRNESKGSLVGLPVSVQVLDKASKPLYANDAPGLDSSLVSVASLGPGAELAWVNDQVTIATPGQSVVAKIGAGAKPGPAQLPQMELTGLKAEADASGEQAITGDVANRSQVEQRRLVVYVTGRKGDKVVAAGRAIVERLAPGKSAHFSVFPIGDPNGAELSAAAPPTVVAP
ncbi:hypothetical protein OM076_14160 [Solirubrobacter ginsenosidimutans]|uniref:Lipoprotein n=1 Tax=Solirubrobacter ginsenosidimutans TaxID=490573 RepID=A0A9X3S1R5_9ACTN|nr:hypothetical protein [Solirubrobacter ginsenosidimutans]MDA0161417.1 hypothetical protein [Solirubrobacter ginsenosidimutans]